MLGRYSNVFAVDVKGPAAENRRLRVSGIGQAFELMTVLVEGEGNVAVCVHNGTVECARAGRGPTSVSAEASTFAATAVIEIEVTHGTLHRCQLLCRAVDTRARPVTVELV